MLETTGSPSGLALNASMSVQRFELSTYSPNGGVRII
jgi:hypothetical protein